MAIRRRVNPKALVIHSLAASAKLPGSDLPLGGRADAVGPSGQPGGQLEGITQLGCRHGHGQVPGLVAQDVMDPGRVRLARVQGAVAGHTRAAPLIHRP
jgi:hypothetical protein